MTKKNIIGISPILNLSESIAIVGSSAKLNSAKNGHVIDSYEDVVRFNRAPVVGHEENVGSKTTLRIANNHVFNNNFEDPSVWTGQPRYFIKDLKNSRVLYFAKDMVPWFDRAINTDPSSDLYCLNYNFLEVKRKEQGAWNSSDFSIGVGFIFLCVISGLKPHLFGFDIKEQASRSHYWEERPDAGPCHNISDEKRFLISLHEQNKIVIK
jgi:hypothetical protein